MIRIITLLSVVVILTAACSTTSPDSSVSAEAEGSLTSETRSEISGDDIIFDDDLADTASGSAFSGLDTPPSSEMGGTQEDLVATIGDRVFFATDSSELSPEARTILEQQAEWLRNYAQTSVIIEGHCDERGTREYNLALGERRANSVKNYLAALGINPERITVISFGKERPAVLGSNPAAWSRNRRSVLVVN